MPDNVVVTFNDRTRQAKRSIGDAVFAAVKRHFEGVVLPDAQARSPIHTGENRTSLKTHCYFSKTGSPAGQIFSTDGYGGFPEHGFQHVGGKAVPAHPYIWPAFQENFPLLTTAILSGLNSIGKK